MNALHRLGVKIAINSSVCENKTRHDTEAEIPETYYERKKGKSKVERPMFGPTLARTDCKLHRLEAHRCHLSDKMEATLSRRELRNFITFPAF